MKIWKPGDECYFLESNIHVKHAIVKAVQGDFCVLRYENGKGIRLRRTKLFASTTEASDAIPTYARPRQRNPYDYDH